MQAPVLLQGMEIRGGTYGGVWDLGGRVADVNGDQFPDIVIGLDVWSGFNGSNYTAYLNNAGGGWTQDNSWAPTIGFAQTSGDDPNHSGGNIQDYGARIVDLNGDGLVDIIRQDGGNYRGTQLNTGSAFGSASAAWDLTINLTAPNTQTVDINNDGLIDALYSFWNGAAYDDVTYLNTGTGSWASTTSPLAPMHFGSAGGNVDQGVRFLDVNGDGMTDAVVDPANANNSTFSTYLNRGNGWSSAMPSWELPIQSGSLKSGETHVGDFNYDGLIDFLYSYTQGGSVVTKVWKHRGVEPDVLSKITYPTGGYTDITYQKSAKYRDGSNNLLNPNLPFNLTTVKTITNNDGNGVTAAYTYSYEGGKYFYNGPFDRKFAGFGKIKRTDSANTVTTTYYHQGDSTNSSQGEYSDEKWKIGKPYRVEVADSSGNVYQKTVNKWDSYDLGTGTKFAKLAQTIEMTYDGNGSHKDRATTYTYSNTTGNVTQQVDWGEVTGADAGTFTDTGSDKYTTDLSYASNTGAYIVGLPSQETVTDQSANKVREVKYYYDSQTLGSVTDGNLTKEERWKSGSTYIDTEKTYNTTYGIVTQEKDARDKATNYTYDTYNLYPATVTNPLSQVTSYTYDYSLGKPKQVTDQNSRVFQTVYDGLDRVIEEKQPDQTTPSTLVTKTAYTYTTQTIGNKIQRTDYLDVSTSVDTYTYTDGFDRVIQTRREMEDANTFAVTDSVYNNIGQLHKVSIPYASTGSAKTSATTTTSQLTTYSYDPMLRVTSIQNALGTVSTAYDDWKKTITDARGKLKDLYFDAYGNLMRVDEHNSGSTYSTYYEYNGNQNLTKITDALSNVRNFTYDGLSRRLTAQDLHATGDATYGTWTYVYDASGNMTSVTDPKNQQIDYTYDDINRQLTENYTGQAGTEVTNTYDSGTDGIGRLSSVVASGANTTYSYTPLGQVKQEVKTISSTNYQTDYTYDRQGNTLEITSPDGSKVKYAYNTAGQLETIQRKESADSGYTNVVTDFDYGPHGKAVYQANANGTATTNTYDATKLYQLSRRLTTAPAGMGGMMFMDAGDGPADMGSSQSVMQVAAAPVELVTATKEQYLAQGNAVAKADGSVMLKQPQEKTEERTEKSKTYLLGFAPDGSEIHKVRFAQKDLHYLNSNVGMWEDVDPMLAPTAMGWSLTKAPFQLTAARNTADGIFTFQNKRDRITLAALSKEVGRGGEGVLDGSKQMIRYTNTFGTGIDLELSVGESEVRKDVVVQSKAALGKLKGEYYEVPFKLTSNVKLKLYSNGKQITESAPTVSTTGATLVDTLGIETYIWPAVMTDSRGTRGVTVPVRYELKADGVYLTKLLPVAWLETASYPVRTDAVLSVYSTASGDGEIYHTHTTWNGIHDATSGTAESTPGTAYAYSEDAGSSFWMGRVALPFDTSSLPDNATVTAADLKVYVDTKGDGDNDANAFLRVVQNTTASATALADGDFDQIGSIDNPTAGSTDVDITGITTGAYLTLSLNTTGRGWINVAGYTKLGLREGHDATDTAPDDATFTGVRVKTADAAGTTQDPILEITYTTNGAPTAPTSLWAEGQANPTGVTDTTPEMSAVYNDPDTSDTSTHYQIQVSTVSNFASTVWDSTQTAFGAALAQSQRSIDIPFGGSALALDGTTYYWRIKFWDAAGTAGAWSAGTNTFTMSSGGAPTTATFYADAAGDGELYHEDTTSWNTVHDATSGTAAAAATTSWTYVEHYAADYWMARTALPFDTSSLPDGATITGATLYVYVDAKDDGDNDGSDFVRVVQNTTASSTSLVNGDFDQVGSVDNPTAGAGDTDITGVATGAYLAIPLNVTGKGWISKTGYTKLGLREGHDATDNAPGTNTGLTGIRIRTANYTGTGSDPYLSVTYTTGAPTPEVIQDLNYTYDNNGNVLTVTDASDTDSAKTTTYTYDDLNRLLSATVTGAVNGSNTTKNYTYNAIGNITAGDAGTYTYAGTGYANPHAVTAVSAPSTTYAYDNNGNITGDGTWTNTWDYANRLTQSAKTGKTVTYAYDHAGQRVKQGNGTTTTIYPTKYYNTDGTTVQKHIFDNQGNTIATIKGSGAGSIAQYVHTDHLSGVAAASNDVGALIELNDYHPYGTARIDWQYSSSFNEQRGFIGQEYDVDTGLNYMNARYYTTIGRFVSQDPIFLLTGSGGFANKWNKNWRDIRPGDGNYSPLGGGNSNENRQAMMEYLSNPQGLNSYSYVTNNPLKYTDPTGEWEVHFSPLIPGVNVGLGGEFGNSYTIGFASDGTFGLSSSVHGGGLAGVDASINWTVGYSNANTWSDTLGTGEYTQVGGKIGAGASITTNYGNGKYTGTDINFGLGARGLPDVPVAFSGGINKTTPVIHGSVKPVVNAIKSGYNAAKNTVTSGANSAKQGASRLYNHVKSKLLGK